MVDAFLFVVLYRICPEHVEAMHNGWCISGNPPPGAGSRICAHYAKTNHACNATGGLMSLADDVERLYIERVEKGCDEGDHKDEL